MRYISAFSIAFGMFGLSGCLTTRAELREVEIKRSQQVSAVQERQAQASARLEEYDQQFRATNGRIDVIENQMAQLNAGHSDRQSQEAKQREEFDKRFRAYEEAIKKLELQVASLNDDLKSMRAKKESVSASGGNSKELFAQAEEAYEKKDYKQAIVDYENYRKASPKGKNYPSATFKIGLAFSELNMKDEAKAFFEEVVAKFPSSKEAKKASQKLKSMK